MMSHTLLPVVLASFLAGCSTRAVEDPTDWYDPGGAFDVTEPVAFTGKAYSFPDADADGIGALFRRTATDDAVLPAPRFTPVFGPDDSYGAGSSCPVEHSDLLPFEIEGVVTAFPRFYFKTNGCDYYQPNLGGSDEKYYGSYFIEDRTGGIFVLGDSKVAHFGMGDRVRLRVRGVKSPFGLDMVLAHDVLELERDAEPIAYTWRTTPFTFSDCCEGSGCTDQDDLARPDTCPIARVHRIRGTVIGDKDTFGSFPILYCSKNGWAERVWNNTRNTWVYECPDGGGVDFTVGLDVELNRRGVFYPVGDQIEVTGPVMYSYSTFSVVVMRAGQVTYPD